MPRPTLLLWTPFAGQMQLLADGLQAAACDLVVAADEAEAVAALQHADGAMLAGVAQGYSAAIAQAVQTAPRLKWLQLLSTGQEAIEQRGGLPAHLQFTGVGDTAAGVVAEHAIALLLALARRLGDAAVQGARAEWSRAYATRMDSLEGRTLALVGYGRIGKDLARRAQAFGMRCIAVNRSGGEAASNATRILPLGRLHEALAQADAAAISLPGTHDTRQLFGAAEWAACKRGALIVNVGRGTVVDSPSLVAALHSGQIGGAGLDVTDPEPLPADHPLWKAPNILITPHVGGAGNPQGVAQLAALIRENVRRFGAGEPLLHALPLPT